MTSWKRGECVRHIPKKHFKRAEGLLMHIFNQVADAKEIYYRVLNEGEKDEARTKQRAANHKHKRKYKKVKVVDLFY